MIVVKLMGGLGNQMFQYAAGKSLALKHNTALHIDASFLEADPGGQYTKRHLELEALNVQLDFIHPAQLGVFQKKSSFWSNLFGKPQAVTLNDTHKFNPAFFEVGNTVYLNGFWQCEKYFKDIRSVILEEFTPKYYLTAEENELVQKLRESESVALHVRRGDYVSLKSAGDFHGVCDRDYYESAVQYMRAHVSNARFYVFSDDLAWCRENFKDLRDLHFVDLKSARNSLDLFLMSYCRHNIIANSSYSWWSAWLNRNGHKIICAPKKWFSDPGFNPDIYCSGWIRL